MPSNDTILRKRPTNLLTELANITIGYGKMSAEAREEVIEYSSGYQLTVKLLPNRPPTTKHTRVITTLIMHGPNLIRRIVNRVPSLPRHTVPRPAADITLPHGIERGSEFLRYLLRAFDCVLHGIRRFDDLRI